MITDYLLLYSKARRENKELQMRILLITSKYEAEVVRLKNELLRPQVRFTSKMDDFAKVMQSVCIACDVTPAQLMSTSREGDIKDARHMLVYVLRHHYALRYSEIGRRLGRDHSTAINSYSRMRDFLEFDKSVQKVYNTVKELLGICN
jgi:chromosomal replication initiation ATPase DnaA